MVSFTPFSVSFTKLSLQVAKVESELPVGKISLLDIKTEMSPPNGKPFFTEEVISASLTKFRSFWRVSCFHSSIIVDWFGINVIEESTLISKGAISSKLPLIAAPISRVDFPSIAAAASTLIVSGPKASN